MNSEPLFRFVCELANLNREDAASLRAWLASLKGRERDSAYYAVCWPEFQMHDGGVFFAGISAESYRVWLHALKGNKTAVQTVMNHRHLLELFPEVADALTEAQLMSIGRKLQTLWQAKLKQDFPTLDVAVIFFEPKDADAENALGYLLTLFIADKAGANRGKQEDLPRLFLGACHPRAHI